MKYLDVRIHLPDWLLHPMQAFIRHGDAIQYEEIRAWQVRPDEGIETELFYVEGDREPFREAVEEVDSLVEYSIAPIDDASFHVWAREETRPETRAWRQSFADRRLIVLPPVRYDADATMAMTVVGDGTDMQALLGDIPDAVDVTVEEIGTYDRRGGTLAGALTDRQLDAVDTALRVGYYEVPRDADLVDVAAALGCAESTASVLLRRAERAVFSRVLDRYGGDAERVTAVPSTA